jgi:hypothetical protein
MLVKLTHGIITVAQTFKDHIKPIKINRFIRPYKFGRR